MGIMLLRSNFNEQLFAHGANPTHKTKFIRFLNLKLIAALNWDKVIKLVKVVKVDKVIKEIKLLRLLSKL